ncbi:hypothetical protein BDY21DRAFT_375383 [Lineolata rhizophorae]|uniref:U6 snRNA phosphodiesterase 1 n=1 Tax=Lineolata rhizophorae TaxID=578093 RepID=A0A6A6NLS9_9PEZI|nr:hypothetical protein BDY21DRAFT_375383 [Lineolata rhizophorae]
MANARPQQQRLSTITTPPSSKLRATITTILPPPHPRPMPGSLVAYPDSESDEESRPAGVEKDVEMEDVAANGAPASTTAAPPAPTTTTTTFSPSSAPVPAQSISGSTAAPSRDALPALPAHLDTAYAVPRRVATTDDPELHGGQERDVGHAEGMYPTFVMVEWAPTEEQFNALEGVVDAVRALRGSSSAEFVSNVEVAQNGGRRLHISLSVTLRLRGEQRAVFKERLLENMRRVRVAAPFEVPLGRLEWWPRRSNNSRITAWMLALQVGRSGGHEMSRLLWAANMTAVSLGLPTLRSEGQQRALPRHLAGRPEPREQLEAAWRHHLRREHPVSTLSLDIRDYPSSIAKSTYGASCLENPDDRFAWQDPFHVTLARAPVAIQDARPPDAAAYTIPGPVQGDAENAHRRSHPLPPPLAGATVPVSRVTVSIGNEVSYLHFGGASLVWEGAGAGTQLGGVLG